MWMNIVKMGCKKDDFDLYSMREIFGWDEFDWNATKWNVQNIEIGWPLTNLMTKSTLTFSHSSLLWWLEIEKSFKWMGKTIFLMFRFYERLSHVPQSISLRLAPPLSCVELFGVFSYHWKFKGSSMSGLHREITLATMNMKRKKV